MGTYSPIITTQGMDLIIESVVNQTQITLQYFAWGDGNGYPTTPSVNQTALVHEVYRQQVDSVEIDSTNSTWLDIITTIPGNVGGFTIREVGIFTSTGILFAVASHPDFYKSVLTDGTLTDFRETLILEITNLTSVNIEINPSVLFATTNYVDSAVTNHHHTGVSPQPSKVLLTSGTEVQGTLPGSMVQEASNSNFGVIKTDGITTEVNSGILSVPEATTSSLGVVQVGSGLSVSNGIISAQTQTLLQDYITGLRLSPVPAGNTVHHLNISEGQCTDSTNSVYMSISNTMILNPFNSAGAGSVDIGQIGNNWYYVYLIQGVSGTNIICSLSGTTPVLPNGYIYFRRIGTFYMSGTLSGGTLIINGITTIYSISEPPLKIWDGITYQTGVTYQAVSNGFLEVYVVLVGVNGSYNWYVYSDSSSTPTTVVTHYFCHQSSYVSGNSMVAFTTYIPINKGDYWNITNTSNIVPTFYIVPQKGDLI